jgi:octaprenyl-diphosphate synthase
MIHAASLLHDDVIDEAYERRGKPSINAIYGNKTSIMFGDILYSKGFYELNNIDREISMIVSAAVAKLSIGEYRDVLLSSEFNTDEDAYRLMIYQKTASLIEASAEAAAVLAGKPRDIYAKYGRSIGIAFQMIDDILDITQQSDTLGKPSMHDFEEGKTTLPYIYLYKEMNTSDKDSLRSLHGKRASDDDKEWIRKKMNEHGIIERAYSEAAKLVEDAAAPMKKLNETNLLAIAEKIIKRDH